MVEGIDGSGKSTLLAGLAAAFADEGLERLCGDRFSGLCELREPTRGPVGQQLRRHLQAGDQLSDAEWLELFFADRRENVSANILPAREAGQLILQDRYFYSTAAYQAIGPERALEIVSESLAADFPEPDVVLYLDIAPEIAMGRIHRRAGAVDGVREDSTHGSKAVESFETLDQLTRIHRNYARVLPAHALRLDAERGPAEMCEIALGHILSMAR